MGHYTKKICLIFKYKLWHPVTIWRFLYYNFNRIHRGNKKFLILAKHTVMDLAKTSRIELRNNVVFGWCNMKKSRLETALYMGENSKITWGVKITDKY